MSRHLYILFRSIAIAIVIHPFATFILYMINLTNNISWLEKTHIR